jgi:hypothetical protein
MMIFLHQGMDGVNAWMGNDALRTIRARIFLPIRVGFGGKNTIIVG